MKWLLFGAIFFLLTWIVEIELLANFDQKIVLHFEQIRSESVTDAFLFISDVGSIKGLLFITALLTVYLIYKKRFTDVLFLMFVFWGSRGLNNLLKNWVERDRPEINPIIHSAGFSFPSGHTMNSTAVLGFICFLLLIHFKSKAFRKTIIGVTVLLVALIGVSRIYLGVHYVTDIIGGFVAGIIWVLIFISLYKHWDIGKS